MAMGEKADLSLGVRAVGGVPALGCNVAELILWEVGEIGRVGVGHCLLLESSVVFDASKAYVEKGVQSKVDWELREKTQVLYRALSSPPLL